MRIESRRAGQCHLRGPWHQRGAQRRGLGGDPPGKDRDPAHGASARRNENCVRGVVKEIAYMGDMSVYLVKIESGRTMRVTVPNVERLSDDERIQLG